MRKNFLKIVVVMLFLTFKFSSAQALYRFYNPSSGLHYYSLQSFPPSGYVSEGTLLNLERCQGSVVVPLYILVKGIDRLMTVSQTERKNALALGYKEESSPGCVIPVSAPPLLPVHRYYNGKEHFYTKDFNELQNGKYKYKYEGFSGF